jgi:uncharacterized protein (DUF983 family)
MAAANPEHPTTMNSLVRGALGRCPRCGRGPLLHRYLKIVERCSACGEPYGHFRADDAPPWLTILLVGHLTAPLFLLIEENYQLSTAVELAILLPFIVGLTLVLLPRCKGAILAAMWVTKAEGSEPI